MNTSFSYLYPVDNFSLVYLTHLVCVQGCKRSVGVDFVLDLVYNACYLQVSRVCYSCYNKIQISSHLPIDRKGKVWYNSCIRGIGTNAILLTPEQLLLRKLLYYDELPI